MSNKLKIIIAVDSFKGSATSDEVSRSIEKGIKKFSGIETEIKRFRVADGGEGTVDAIVKANGGTIEYVKVEGPTGKPVMAKSGIIFGNTAILEMAEASGLSLVPEKERNPFRTTTYGVGEMIKFVLDKGIRKIFIGAGGSATNDGGAGMLHSLGVRFYDKNGNELGCRPDNLKNFSKVDISDLDKRISETEITVLSDVSNPLYGKNGASYIYGPQKGASPEDTEILDSILKNFGTVIDQELGTAFSESCGAGAAGGLGYALLAVCRAKFKAGISEIIKISL